MARCFCGLLLTGILVTATPVIAQQATNRGLVTIIDGKVTQAYVAGGREGKDLNEQIWVEIRLLDVAAGKYRTLIRASAPATVPGSPPNFELLSFLANGQTLAAKTIGPGGNQRVLLIDVATGKERQVRPGEARLKGMRDAVSDLELGFLKQKQFPPPSPAWYGDFLDAAKKQCGVDYVNVEDGSVLADADQPGAELEGYNEVMRLEIEVRFGKGILGRLHEKAMNDYLKNKQPAALPRPKAEVFVHPHKLTAGAKLTGADEPTEIKSDTILIWVDLMPGARFIHPTEFILISAEGTRVVKGSWWPTLDGQDLFRDGKTGKVNFPLGAAGNGQTVPSSKFSVHSPQFVTPRDKLVDFENVIDIQGESAFIWVDLAPDARFSHPTKYILISAAGTRVIDGQWWPTLNGQALFREGVDHRVSFPVQINN